MLKEIIYTFRGKKGIPAREPVKAVQEVPRVSELDLTSSQVVNFLDSLIEGVFVSFYRESVVEAGGSVDNASILDVINDYLSDGRSGVAAERFAAFTEALKEFLKAKGKSGPAVSQLLKAVKGRMKEAVTLKESTLNQYEHVITVFAQVDGVLDEFGDVLEILTKNIENARNAQTTDDLII